MWEDRIKRRLQRWSQWQTQLAATKDKREASSPPGASGDRLPPRARFARAPEAARQAYDVRNLAAQATELSHGIEVTNRLGRYWHICRPLAELWPASVDFLARVQNERASSAHLDAGRDEFESLITAFPNQVLFLDLETCGLAGSAIFLVGLIRFSAGQLRLEQLWARNHAEEAGLIGGLCEIVACCDLLVTFNGKSFDWPMVRDRATLHTRQLDGALKPLAHLDLLHHCRRRFRKRFGDCKLQTLELHVCGRHRTGDVAGGQIPSVYAEYVRTADPRLVQPILHHNALDLITLLQLAGTLLLDPPADIP